MQSGLPYIHNKPKHFLRRFRAVIAPVFCAVLLALPNPAGAQEPSTENLQSHGCLACHTVDGTRAVGPSFLGIIGRSVEVVDAGGASSTVVVDEAFVRASITDPGAAVRVGYPPGTMPAYTLEEAELAGIVTELAGLSQTEAVTAGQQDEPSLWPVILFTALFVFGHLGLSSGPIRSRLVGALGEGPFQGLYAVVAAIGISGMFWSQATGPYVPLWPTYGWMPIIPLLIMPVVLVLWVAGFTTRNATAAGQTDVLQEAEPARGIAKITRHPANTGFGLWALCHLVVNGDLASVIVFGGILFLAIVGTLHIEARRRAKDPEGWARLTAVTSIIPFVAIIQGRTRVTLREIGYARIGGALVLYAMFLGHLHELMMGVSPMPW